MVENDTVNAKNKPCHGLNLVRSDNIAGEDGHSPAGVQLNSLIEGIHTHPDVRVSREMHACEHLG
jgi:hypothetical protein